MRSGTTAVLGMTLIILFGFPAMLPSTIFLPYCGMRVEGLPVSRYNEVLEQHMTVWIDRFNKDLILCVPWPGQAALTLAPPTMIMPASP